MPQKIHGAISTKDDNAPYDFFAALTEAAQDEGPRKTSFSNKDLKSRHAPLFGTDTIEGPWETVGGPKLPPGDEPGSSEFGNAESDRLMAEARGSMSSSDKLSRELGIDKPGPLVEIRAAHPEYDDLSDEQLTQAWMGKIRAEGQPDTMGAVGRFLGGAAETTLFNPVNAAKGIYGAVAHPYDTFVEPTVRHLGQVGEAVSDIATGDTYRAPQGPGIRAVEAVKHLGGAVPLIGDAGVRAGEHIGEGNIAEGAGELTGLASNALLPAAAKGIAKRAPGALKSAGAGMESAGEAVLGSNARIQGPGVYVLSQPGLMKTAAGAGLKYGGKGLQKLGTALDTMQNPPLTRTHPGDASFDEVSERVMGNEPGGVYDPTGAVRDATDINATTGRYTPRSTEVGGYETERLYNEATGAGYDDAGARAAAGMDPAPRGNPSIYNKQKGSAFPSNVKFPKGPADIPGQPGPPLDAFDVLQAKTHSALDSLGVGDTPPVRKGVPYRETPDELVQRTSDDFMNEPATDMRSSARPSPGDVDPLPGESAMDFIRRYTRTYGTAHIDEALRRLEESRKSIAPRPKGR